MPQNRRRRSSDIEDDEDDDLCSWRRTKANIKRFCSNKYWCTVKLIASFIIVLDVVIIIFKWYYLMSRPEAYRLAIHIAEKILYPYWFTSILVCGFYIWYGIMDEYLWAMSMYVFNNVVQVIFLDILLFAELIVVLTHGHETPWTHLTVGMTLLRMCLVTLWHSFVIYVALALENGIKAKWRDQKPSVAQLCCPCVRKT